MTYSAECTASAGNAPYAWSIVSGTLPTGLSLTSTANPATISGTPTVPGSYSYSVQFADSSTPTPQTAQQAYSGTIAAIGTLIPSPASLTFADQALGTTSEAQLVTARNTSLSPITITNIASTGDFGETDTCQSGPTSPGATCQINVTFTPTLAGTRTGEIIITEDVPGSPQLVTLAGTGLLGPLILSPLNWAFPGQGIGTTGTPLTVTATNTNLTPITITNIASSIGDFTETNNCESGPIAPSGYCTINVTFTPAVAGNRTGEIIVTDDALGSPQTVALSGVGLGPLSLSPLSLAFAGQAVGNTSPPLSVIATNTSSTPITIASVASTVDFAQTNDCESTTVAPGTYCTINVTFTPSVPVNRTGQITVTDDAQGSPQTVPLTGAGLGSLSLSPTSLTFTPQAIGTTSPTQAVMATNTSAKTVNVTSIVANHDFAATNTCGSAIPAGVTCTIFVTFTPTLAGNRTGDVIATDSAPASPQNAALSGVGLGPLGLVPTTLTFPAQAIGTTSPPQAVMATNTSTAVITIASITPNVAFAETNTCGSTIAPAATCTIFVTFTPTLPSKQTGAINVNDDAPGSPQTVTLTGTGNGPVAKLSPKSLKFATQLVGTVSAKQTVTLTNTGNATLNIVDIFSSGAFTQTNTCGSSLSPIASCGIFVVFAPAAKGSLAGTVSVNDNASGSPQLINLHGSATVAEFAPPSLSFGDQKVGTASTPQTVTFTNTGSTTLQKVAINITGANAADFAQTNTCGSKVSALAACSINVTFTPTAQGARSAAVSISDSGGGSPQTVTLAGTGT